MNLVAHGIGTVQDLPLPFWMLLWGGAVVLARRVAGSLSGPRVRWPARLGEAWLPLTARPVAIPRIVCIVRATGRGPPLLVGS